MLINAWSDTTSLIIASLIMVMALIFHNMVQTFVARRLGDLTPTYQGFGRFDPQTHLEPMGVLLLLVLGFGWPKPIPTNSRNYPGRGRQEALVWYSGPATYIGVAAIAWSIMALFIVLDANPGLVRAFDFTARIAVWHAVINLFPVHPLDGARAALAWGGHGVRRVIHQLAQLGIVGFILVFLTLRYTGILGMAETFVRFAILSAIGAVLRLFGAIS